jgi:predicted RNA methylase
MKAYTQAIQELCRGKTVIDVGAGTGALSIIAARSGAIKGYAIEASRIADQAKEIISASGMGKPIVLINELAENVEIPDLKVDIILSEWMGYFLIKERMLPFVTGIRDKYLSPNGVMVPRQALLYIAGF